MENEYGLDKNGVRELNINDFDVSGGGDAKCITNNDKSGALVFYQAWCPHCRTIVDDVVSANKSLGNKHIILAVHGQTPKNDEVFDRFGIMGIPSIKFMKKDGSVTSDFEGERTANNLIEFIKTNSTKDDSKSGKKKKKEKKKEKKEKPEKKETKSEKKETKPKTKKVKQNGGSKKTVRKHRGIVQTGGNTGKLRKGYRYSGKTLKNGKPEIIKAKRN